MNKKVKKIYFKPVLNKIGSLIEATKGGASGVTDKGGSKGGAKS